MMDVMISCIPVVRGMVRARAVEALDLQDLRQGPGDAVDGRRCHERRRPAYGDEKRDHDARDQSGEHDSHLPVGGGATDLLHDDALKAPAEGRYESDENRPCLPLTLAIHDMRL